MSTLLQDLRYGLRQLRRSPGFTFVSVLTIAVGTGATSVVFIAAHDLLMRPLPVESPEGLAIVRESWDGWRSSHNGYTVVSYPRLQELADGTSHLFAGLAGHRVDAVSLMAGDRAEVRPAVIATANYFDVLGVRPALGRHFGAAEEHDPVVVLSHRYWADRLGRDPHVVGRTVLVNGRAHTVVGVTAEGFRGLMWGDRPDVWIPAGAFRQHLPTAEGEDEVGPEPWLVAVGRLGPGLTREQAESGFGVVAANVPERFRQAELEEARLEPVRVLSPSDRTDIARFLGLLLAASGMVLLIGSANVGGMLLARASARTREVAVRRAIGAGRGRLLRQLLTETLLLFAIGGGGGVLLAYGLASLFVRVPSVLNDELVLNVAPSLPVVAMALAVTLAVAVSVGLAPAMQGTTTPLLPALGGGAPGRKRTRLRSTFVVAQLSVTLVLLVSAGLFVRSLQAALAADVGFEVDGVVVARVELAPHGYGPDRALAFFDGLVERLGHRPEIRSAALTDYPPLSSNVDQRRVERLAEGGAPAEETTVRIGFVDPGFFETLGVPLRTGRGIEASDRAGAPPVVVVNETMAARLWPGEPPLGRVLRLGDREYEVVGVVPDGRYENRLEITTPPYAYFSVAQAPRSAATVLVRAAGDEASAQRALREEIAALDPAVGLGGSVMWGTGPLRELADLALLPQRLAAIVVGFLGSVALALAGIGIFGILAFHVNQRRREIGVRLALGARAPDVLRLVLRQGAVLVSVGIGTGLVGAAALTRLLSSLLFGVAPMDPLTLGAVAGLLAAVALVAAFLPARRAAGVDPMVALRAE